ncbi:FAD-binding oxidoreductase [Paracoccus suum]|uniref:FAD-binding oxidoreductase n=1 Tax=Paracoccus suum TaxID=2259340 RepID=A0A344PLC5_9RHOB|nr:FAD-binding oxidoreductase [Paracoccus suum]AXC50180.1 FAD-binding oxidoreductase [Paracoccus suum]
MSSLAEELRAIVGDRHVLQSEAEMAPYLVDWMGKYHGQAQLVVSPGTTAEVSDTVRACARHGAIVVPQGGNTSLSGGATPGSAGAVVLSTRRLRTLRRVDPVGNTITAEAGCILAEVQQAAQSAGRYFPLSLGAEGSCTIGGNVATSAGGVAVLRYGNMRDLTLGVEVVLPDGRLFDGLRDLRKDSTGYSLRDLFVGSEGTLGIITAATLRLFPTPRASVTAMASVEGLDQAVSLLNQINDHCGDRLSAFEYISGACLSVIAKHVPSAPLPLPAASDAVLIELTDSHADAPLAAMLEEQLVTASEAGLISDAVVAQNAAQAGAFWKVREAISEALVREGGSAKHDVAVPVSSLPEFVADADAAVQRVMPGARPVIFGHLGDGNLHYNLLRPVDAGNAFPGWDRVTSGVHAVVSQYRGSISAEHGIGQLRVGEMPAFKGEIELELMQRIKGLLDPQGLFNPGKLLPL